MPKKTRKEKLLTKQRRLQQIPRIEKTSVEIVQEEILTPEETVSMKYFLQDLKKSLILIISIIALEIAIYFVSIYSTLKF